MNPSDWLSFHIYYYEDLLRPIQGLVRPVVVDLLQTEKIDRFFFVRYGLGGPHLRLRLRSLIGKREVVKIQVEKQTLEWLESSPSRSSLSREAIERSTETLLQSDHYETDDSIYPDNSLQLIPFQPETDRYGGPELLEASLDFFSVSSSEALVFLHNHAAAARSRQLPFIFRLLLRQAIGYAANADELDRTLRYAEISWAETFPSIMEKADATFDRQRDVFTSLFEQEMRACLDASEELAPDNVLFKASRSLRQATERLDPHQRWIVGGSQLHMTANRLAVSNPEEVYLGRLLSRTWHHLQSKNLPDFPLFIMDQTLETPNGSEATLRWMKLKLEELAQSPGTSF